MAETGRLDAWRQRSRCGCRCRSGHAAAHRDHRRRRGDLGGRRRVGLAATRRRAVARGHRRSSTIDAAADPTLLLPPLHHHLRDRRRDADRRLDRARRRPGAGRQLEVHVSAPSSLSLLSRAVPEDHLLPGHDHVVRGRTRLEDRDGRDVVLLPGRAQRRRRHARDRQGADPRRPQLPRQHLADGHQDLSAGDAPADRSTACGSASASR